MVINALNRMFFRLTTQAGMTRATLQLPITIPCSAWQSGALVCKVVSTHPPLISSI